MHHVDFFERIIVQDRKVTSFAPLRTSSMTNSSFAREPVLRLFDPFGRWSGDREPSRRAFCAVVRRLFWLRNGW